MPQIYHGCGLVRQENGLNEIIDLKKARATEAQYTYHIGNFVILRDKKLATSGI